MPHTHKSNDALLSAPVLPGSAEAKSAEDTTTKDSVVNATVEDGTTSSSKGLNAGLISKFDDHSDA